MALVIASSLVAMSCICPVLTAGFILMDVVHCVAVRSTTLNFRGLCMSKRDVAVLWMMGAVIRGGWSS